MKYRSGDVERPARGGAVVFWPPPRDGWIAIASVALIYGAHWLYGALISDAAMLLNIGAAVLVGGALLSPRLRNDVLRLKGLAAPAICFGIVISVALWTLTPWTLGGPHPVWAYVGVAFGASTIDKSATTIEIVKLLGLGCIFVVGAATGGRDDRARYAIELTIAAGVIFGIWALVGSSTGSIYQSGGHRLEGHFLNPNTAGTVFAVLLILSVAQLVRALRPPKRNLTHALPSATASLALLVCLLDSASRGAALAFLVASLVYLGLQIASGHLKLGSAIIGSLLGIAALIFVVSIAGEQLIDRIFDSHEASIARLDIWRFHWQTFVDSPLFGYGLGTSETVNKSLLTLSNYDRLWNIRSILNVYLQWLEEAGIIGAAPMFACLALLLATTVRNSLRRHRMAGLLASLIAADAVVMIHGATDFGLEVPSVAAFWAWLLGVQYSLAQGSSNR